MNSRDVQHQQQQQLTYLAARGGVPTRCDPHLSPLLLPFCGICSTSGLQAPTQAGLIAMISLTSRKCDTSFVASVSSLHLSFVACVWTLWVCVRVCVRERDGFVCFGECNPHCCPVLFSWRQLYVCSDRTDLWSISALAQFSVMAPSVMAPSLRACVPLIPCHEGGEGLHARNPAAACLHPVYLLPKWLLYLQRKEVNNKNQRRPEHTASIAWYD